ncbi:hypothetical protein EVAR_99304_1 [Eumeta japonica]|uniref:Uncharacterized protein n=1 Tax=Eumeta variegata TaxID=151549 RepID=A0A4C1YXY5_EUMVA|nr:hypothetical protein EVAR_99304_1 [Eumeta japonica]
MFDHGLLRVTSEIRIRIRHLRTLRIFGAAYASISTEICDNSTTSVLWVVRLAQVAQATGCSTPSIACVNIPSTPRPLASVCTSAGSYFLNFFTVKRISCRNLVSEIELIPSPTPAQCGPDHNDLRHQCDNIVRDRWLNVLFEEHVNSLCPRLRQLGHTVKASMFHQSRPQLWSLSDPSLNIESGSGSAVNSHSLPPSVQLRLQMTRIIRPKTKRSLTLEVGVTRWRECGRELESEREGNSASLITLCAPLVYVLSVNMRRTTCILSFKRIENISKDDPGDAGTRGIYRYVRRIR